MPSTPVPAGGSAAVAARHEAAPGPPAAGMGWRGDLVTTALSAWLILGLFVDGWAHNTRPRLETFFTPWHALFYSGFAALAAWVWWSVWRRRRPGTSLRTAIPPGYGLAVVGLALFLASGLGDMAWHLAFGIERSIAALLSPTHLGLFLGALLAVTAPLRSAWAAPDGRAGLGRLLPAVLSATLAGVLVAFMFQYLHPVDENVVSLGHRDFLVESFDAQQVGYVRELGVIAGIAGFLGVIGAVAVEGLVLLLRPGGSGRPWRLPAFALAAPVAFWGVYLAGIGLHDGGLGWAPELWGGALVWSSLTLLGLAALPPAPAPPAPATPRR
jgi:hypothetical protein